MHTHDSMKPVGPWEVKRSIKIPALSHEADGIAVERAIHSLSGISKVSTDVGKQKIIVRYDTRQSEYRVILALLEQVGFPPVRNWWNNFKGNWYQYCDTNARDNAKLPPPACCNKPPK